MKKKKVIVIGCGFGGLSAAALLAKDGFDVTVLEKNALPGGRARVLKKDGFSFDMGPSWYLMPDVFEKFFAIFGKKPSDFYKLIRLDPSYRIFFNKDDVVDISADVKKNITLFESIEKGSGEKLKEYLAQASYQYQVSMKEFVYKDYNSIFDFFNLRMLSEGRKLHVFETLDKFTKRYFVSDRLRKILEYSMVFLGGAPSNTPALYSVINHADMNLGVWYPEGGFGSIIQALKKLGTDLGVSYKFNSEVTGFEYEGDRISGVKFGNKVIKADIVVVNADYHFVDQNLLKQEYRDYQKSWWEKRVVAPSAFILYVGLNKKLKKLTHHNLFLDKNWIEHFNSIFKNPSWPESPSFYLCVPSVSDRSVAPKGKENLFFLAPIASGLKDNPTVHKKLKEDLYKRLEQITGQNISDHIEFEKVFSVKDFAKDYNAFKGTGLGLAHTLMQTAIFRPRMRSKKLKNLYYVGQNTQPGIGIPMVIISGQIVAEKIKNEQI